MQYLCVYRHCRKRKEDAFYVSSDNGSQIFFWNAEALAGVRKVSVPKGQDFFVFEQDDTEVHIVVRTITEMVVRRAIAVALCCSVNEVDLCHTPDLEY